ncbi:hypothetical protein F2Q68_00044072 [Brassica cretica]|uniref:Uncharacterized protein n=1 Tax=Brassica cretica TaxID=69181 RepID=A0A8S9LKG2_BRACR|nr:hypothetical protein F2Q68_00044072 [Brassica cretica]
MRRRSTEESEHLSTILFTIQTEDEHRPTLPTTHQSTTELTVQKKETTPLAVGQMIIITRAMKDPEGYAREIDGHTLQVSIEDIADILEMANGTEHLFMQQRNIPEHQQRVANEFYNTDGGVYDRFKPKYRQHTRPSIDIGDPTSIDRRPDFGKRAYDRDGSRRFHLEEKDEYGVYGDDHGHARDVDGHIIRVSKNDIRNLLEIASMDEHSYLCLPEHASINWLTTCMEEMRQDIARKQTQRAAKATTPASIDINLPISIDIDIPTSIDDDPSPSNPTKSQPDSYSRVEIDQIVEEIYRTLGAAEERFDTRCDDIYFPWDITISSLTSQTEAMQREIVEIQRYIARRPEASTSIYIHINISTDCHRRTSIDEATPTNRGGLVPKVISDMSDINNHGEEISADTYATPMRHQFKFECLGDKLQKIENATTTMNDNWRRADKSMINLTSSEVIWKKMMILEIIGESIRADHRARAAVDI